METELRIRQSSLECADEQGALLWSLPIASLALIAEYTTNEGPWVDDYFFVFVTVEEGKLYFSSCPMYAGERDATLKALGEILQSQLELGLVGSTKWDSRVLWPPEMAGSKYYEFTAEPAETLAEKVKKTVFGQTLEYRIAGPVREYLLSRGSNLREDLEQI